MSKMMMRCSAGVVGSMLALSGAARADMIGIMGNTGGSTEQTGATYTGTLNYTHLGGSNGSLVISLLNATPGGVGGYLTALAFRFPITGSASGAALTGGPTSVWKNLPGASAAPFGNFTGVASTGNNWEGGGNPSAGIGVGATGTWTFAITDVNAASLTAQSFLGTANAPGFVVRFRGLTDGGSDKVPGQVDPNFPTPNLPAPGAAGLAGLAGVLAARRRRA